MKQGNRRRGHSPKVNVPFFHGLEVPTPFGKFYVEASERGVVRLAFPGFHSRHCEEAVGRRSNLTRSVILNEVKDLEILRPAFSRPQDDALRQIASVASRPRNDVKMGTVPILVRDRLRQYFSGKKVSFSDIPIDYSGLTAFQAKVLRSLAKVPYGKRVCYADLARAAGNPKAGRAVGNVMQKNRLPILLPCHRVVRSNGSLGGYSQGLAWKKKFLRLEGVLD